MVKDGMSYFRDLKHNEVSILSFDIETNGVTHDNESQVVLISNTFRDSKGNVTRKLFAYDEYEYQEDMISHWCQWVREVNPSILCGHNIFGFDLPYLDHCSVNGLPLGRNGSMMTFDSYESAFRKDGSQSYAYKKAHVYGRSLVDTMFLAFKYDVGRKYESYGLKQIIKQEGLERTDRVFYDASQIRHHYKDPEQMKLIKAYAEMDADDSLALYDLMAPPFFYMAQSIPKTYQEVMLGATGSQINSIMMRAYLQDGHSLPKADQAAEYQGAISFGDVGIYRDVYKVDVASLYPSIMIEYEVFDDTKDPKAYFSNMVKTFTELRLEYKKKAKEDKYFDDLQGAYKIFINSCYGFLGTNGLLFNCPAAAAFITETGREVLQKAIDWAKAKSFTIVNADTDSIAFCSKLEALTDPDTRKALLADLNSLYPAKIHFEDDGFFPVVIVFAAKNYILFDGKKIKTKGSALKDSKREIALKEFAQEVIKTLLDCTLAGTSPNEAVQSTYLRYVYEVRDGIRDIKRWCSKKTLTDKIWSSPRENEAKVLRAIQGTEYKEADKVWMFFLPSDELCLMERFTGEYNREKLYEKLYKSAEFFTGVLPEDLFINYKLKKNQKLLYPDMSA
jgi:DNA polymerase I